MKKEKTRNSDEFGMLMKKQILDIPSKHFSQRLVEIAVNSYKTNYSIRYKKEEWLGKVIICILIFFNLSMFYHLESISEQPTVLMIILALAIGLGILIKLNLKVTVEK